MKESGGGDPVDLIERPERVERTDDGAGGSGGVAHLADNRALIVKRSLLASVVGGAVPLPVMDDYLAGRVRAGMLIKIAERRRVDLAQSSADLLADPREGTALRNATLTAATMVALKLAWKKFFALLAVGRRAEDMATSFQTGTLFDHYCARLHVGAGIDRERASQLRAAMHAAISHAEKDALVGAFKDGGKVLGRSAGEAPRWISDHLTKLAERWVRTGGRPAGDADPLDETELPADDSRWLDRAARAVETSLTSLGNTYLAALVADFEKRWRAIEAERVAKAAEAATKAARATPPSPAS